MTDSMPVRSDEPTDRDTTPVEHHWFVSDASGLYCLACGLPEHNGRHVPKPVSA